MTCRIGRPVHILSPGPIGQLTGGFGFLRRLRDGLIACGEQVAVHELIGPHPFAGDAARRHADQVLAGIADGDIVLVDGLALPAAGHALWVERYRLRQAALVHHPLHLEAGLPPEQADALARLERDSLAQVRQVIVPSRATRDGVVALGVPARSITIVNPGTDPAAPAMGSGDGIPTMLCVATLTPRKGHLVLIEALAPLAHLPWRLVLVGSGDYAPDHGRALAQAIEEAGLAARVHLAGQLSGPALEAAWEAADLFVLPSLHEGYGMVAAEAMARGLPLVVSDAGALAEFVPAAAGALVPPGDAAALRMALEWLLTDPTARTAAAGVARTAGARLPRWEDSTAAIRTALANTLPPLREIERIA